MHVSPPLMFQSVDVVWWRLLLPGGCVPVFVCLCVCVCMPVFVWPCVPLLSAVILPASGFDKDKQCGGKWMNSWPHFVSVRLAQFYLARHTLHLHPMCLMSILGPRKTLNSRNETERTRGRTSKPKTFFFFFNLLLPTSNAGIPPSTEKSCEDEIGERGEWFADVKRSSLQVKVVQVVSLKNKEGGVGRGGRQEAHSSQPWANTSTRHKDGSYSSQLVVHLPQFSSVQNCLSSKCLLEGSSPPLAKKQ